ncbi:protein kinase [Rothia nasimurium]|uniref:protein kinase n=1 Tax=Rothia nasimurium TaxID=85336 RepID=UPI001F01BBFA|nr:protein kinase [Rothia nasimurium]
MSTPTDLPQPTPASVPPEPENDQALPIPGNLPDVTPRYRLESGAHHSTWIVDCGYQSAAHLELQAGPYTLTQITGGAEASAKSAERLCSLTPHPAVLRVDAVTSSQDSYHIWYESAEAGTLADYCRAKGKLPLGQVTTVARALTQALGYLHEQGFAYSELASRHCVFTVRGELKLLAPDIDTRPLASAVQKSRQADDIAACAALLWLCLTGEEPKAMRLRAPLNLAVPQASDALAQTLEDAIDSRAQQPQLTDLLALIELAADPEPLELHLSAHQSVRSRLPAYRPLTPAEPRRSLAQRRQVYGKLPDFSRGSKAKARKPSRSKPVGQGASQLPLGRFIRERWAMSGAVLIGALALGGVGYQLSFAEGQGEDAVTVTSQAPHSLPALELPEAGQQLAGGAQQIADGQERAPASELTNDELALEAAQLVAARSQVLATGATERISDYAVMDSPLAEADRQLLTSQGAADLAGMSTELLTVAEVTETEQGFKVRGTVQATGYTPTASGEELAAQGIKVEEGKVLQEVELTLQIQGESYLLAQAQPLALEQPKP